MKTLITILVNLIIGLLTMNAQTSSTSSSKSSSTVTISISDDSEEKNYSRSFAIIDMGESFRIKIRFMKYKENDVKSYLIDQFGKENMTIEDEAYLWKKEIENEELYEVRLRGNKLRINLDKELASNKLIKKFERIGKELKSITSKNEN
ncbi:hypothetical protein ATE84_2793 [Aquimarina sp. MAR_2010_214]|uniref:hypothetical protein n=1 Tax=Aquimarina sp. MAR_2010_214 TaxID=1250026 RepID=UPI000C711D0E|nr:hypothetical protein [Aquimarina sp. MAR_2010_214]PKV50727.1 hypothetical protein ATE84_2793 [Aquimarina sp. MAR_2010_214]